MIGMFILVTGIHKVCVSGPNALYPEATQSAVQVRLKHVGHLHVTESRYCYMFVLPTVVVRIEA